MNHIPDTAILPVRVLTATETRARLIDRYVRLAERHGIRPLVAWLVDLIRESDGREGGRA